jgi:hypothetical protein
LEKMTQHQKLKFDFEVAVIKLGLSLFSTWTSNPLQDQLSGILCNP